MPSSESLRQLALRWIASRSLEFPRYAKEMGLDEYTYSSLEVEDGYLAGLASSFLRVRVPPASRDAELRNRHRLDAMMAGEEIDVQPLRLSNIRVDQSVDDGLAAAIPTSASCAQRLKMARLYRQNMLALAEALADASGSALERWAGNPGTHL